MHRARPDIVIVLMTAFDIEVYNLPPFIKKQDVIKKPFGKKELLETVRWQLNITA